MELDLDYWNQNVRGRQGLRKGQSLILCTVGKLLCDSRETLQKNSVVCSVAFPSKLNKDRNFVYLILTSGPLNIAVFSEWKRFPKNLTSGIFPNPSPLKMSKEKARL